MIYALIFLGVIIVGNSVTHYVLHRTDKRKLDALSKKFRVFDNDKICGKH